MIVEFNLTNLIFIAIALCSGALAAIKMFYVQFEKSQDVRFSAMAELLKKNQETTLQIERDFLKFQGEIPRLYLRRDDYLRDAQALQDALQREIAPIRISVNRIEDFLIQK